MIVDTELQKREESVRPHHALAPQFPDRDPPRPVASVGQPVGQYCRTFNDKSPTEY